MIGRLPPGQIETQRFPTVGERRPSSELEEPGDWSLALDGEVDAPLTVGLEEFLAMAVEEINFDIHCVTSWSRFDSTFTGMPLASLLDRAQVRDRASFVSFGSFSVRSHHVSLSLDVALQSSWVVHSFEGEPLATEHGGPVRVVTPGRYFYKSVKWLKSVSLLVDDRLGWWEQDSSYHNNADPWPGDQRFTTGSIRPGQLERFLSADSYDKYRNRVLLGLDLSGWKPTTQDLRRLYLKNCDMSGIDLSGADLRESNLTLSDLSGASLVSADVSGSDLEGADFTDADLAGANLSDTALAATRFDGAKLEGAVFNNARGLVESQEAYLTECGITLPGRSI